MKNGLILAVILMTSLVAKAGGVSDACVRFALDRSFPRIAVGERSKYFVQCSSEQAAPQRGQIRPVYSDKDVKQLHDVFIAVTDCLEIDPQMLFPKLMMESGLHIQIQNPGGDAGIGQLTSKAIADVDQSLPAFKKYIYSSPKNSCRWLRTQTEQRRHFWKPISGLSKCALMAKANNPMRNILYTSIFHKLNESYVDHEFDAGNIAGLLKDAGYPGEDYRPLKRIIVALGYNTGGAVAVRNLQQFLLSRVDYIQRKGQEPNATPADLALVGPQDFNFTQGLGAFDQRKESLKNFYKQIQPDISDKDLEAVVGKALRNISASQYTFPEWLKVWQSHGGPGYISSVVWGAQILDRKFGVGVCSNADNYQILPIPR